MSVAIIIDSEEYEDFYICVSGEASYMKYWCPAIEALGLALKWAPYFQSGCTFDKKDWPRIAKEMLLIKDWILTHLGEEEKQQAAWFCDRFDQIINQVNAHFMLDNRRLWIG